MAINSQARDYALGQMSRSPEFRGALSQMQGRSANTARLAEDFQRLNPNNYNRYDPSLGAYSTVGNLRGSMAHGANFTGDLRNWYALPGEEYVQSQAELTQDLFSRMRKGPENLSPASQSVGDRAGLLSILTPQQIGQKVSGSDQRSGVPNAIYSALGIDPNIFGGTPAASAVEQQPKQYSTYGDPEVYQELMRDLEEAEKRGNVGYIRDIDTSRGKDNVDYRDQYGTQDVDRQTTMDAYARSLASYGIQDMADIGYAQGPDGAPVFYNQRTGKALPQDLFTASSKKVNAGYGLDIDEQGNIFPTFDSTFTATRAKRLKRNGAVMTAVAAVAAPFALPALGATALGGALGSVGTGALYGAGTGALSAGLGGGDIAKGALLGGVGGGVGQYAKGLDFVKGMSSPIMQGATVGGISGATTGGLGALAYGGDPLKGALSGAISGGMGGAGSAYFGGGNSLLGGIQRSLGSRIGSQFGQQIAGNLIGSPYEQQQRLQQYAQQQQQRPMPQQQIPSWMPQHVQQAVLGFRGA